MMQLRKLAGFVQYFTIVPLAGACLIGLSGCADQTDGSESARSSAAELRHDIDDADSGTADPYQPCTQSSDCGGDNALCASYVPDEGSQFCAPFCQFDALCPTILGFESACNLAWCAVLCNDDQCPAGMRCARGVSFLDFQGNDRGKRNVCVYAPVADTSSQ